MYHSSSDLDIEISQNLIAYGSLTDVILLLPFLIPFSQYLNSTPS